MNSDHPLFELLNHQTDLEALCAERPLEWGEWAHMNAFHGNAAILKAYAGLDPDEPLPVSVEHAIPYDLQEAYAYDAHSGLPTFWAVNEKSAAAYRKSGMGHVETIGSTHLYAIELFRQLHPDEKKPARMGTLAFPDKSTLLKDTDFDRGAWARALVSLPVEFQPVVVCIYWRDFLRGRHRPFVEASLPVVSCGHLLDPLFALRLHDLCRRFKYSCANDIAGSFALSILSGCRFFHLPGGPLVETKAGVTKHLESDPTLEQDDKKACLAASAFPPSADGQQAALAAQLAGSRHLKNPSQLREMAVAARERLQSQARFEKVVLGPEAPRARWFAFSPKNIDYDGWAMRYSRLRVPAGLKAARLEMKIKPVLNMFMIVWRNGERYRVVKDRNKIKSLSLNCLPDTETVFEFETGYELVLPGETRTRSFRIEELKAVSTGVLARWGASLGKNFLTQAERRPAIHVLSRYCPQDLKSEPFPYWLGEQAAVPEMLHRLEQEFPDWRTFLNGASCGENEKFRRSAVDLLQDSEVSSLWKDFIRAHIDPSAARMVWELFEREFRNRFPSFAERLGPARMWRVGLRNRDHPADFTVLLDAQLTIHTPCPTRAGIQRGPHLKNPNKLFEAQLFFPFWNDPPGTEFQIFQVKPGKRAPLYEHNETDPEALELVDRARMVRGMMCFFLLGPDSWTQISARGPSHQPLRYFSTLLQFPFDLFERRYEKRAIGDSCP